LKAKQAMFFAGNLTSAYLQMSIIDSIQFFFAFAIPSCGHHDWPRLSNGPKAVGLYF
jgi:hypothetical protein